MDLDMPSVQGFTAADGQGGEARQDPRQGSAGVLFSPVADAEVSAGFVRGEWSTGTLHHVSDVTYSRGVPSTLACRNSDRRDRFRSAGE